EASRAEDAALQYATTAATARPRSSPDPAARAAGARAAKIPAPTIEPRPMTTASPTPRVRRRPGPEGAVIRLHATDRCNHRAYPRRPYRHNGMNTRQREGVARRERAGSEYDDHQLDHPGPAGRGDREVPAAGP